MTDRETVWAAPLTVPVATVEVRLEPGFALPAAGEVLIEKSCAGVVPPTAWFQIV